MTVKPLGAETLAAQPDPAASPREAGTFDEIYPILMELFTEGEVTSEPLPPEDDASEG